MKVKIEKIIDFPEAYEKHVYFSIGNAVFEAFHHERQDFAEGEIADVKLSVVAFTIRKTTASLLTYKYSKEQPLGVNEYFIIGKVVGSEGKSLKVDGGNGLVVLVGGYGDDYKMNERVSLTGRLDIEKI